MTGKNTPSNRLPRVLLLTGLGLTGLAVAGTLVWHRATDPQAVAAGIEWARPWLALWRAALFVVLIGYWEWPVNWLAGRYGWSAQHHEYVMAQRWRVALWLIVIELVLVQNLVGKSLGGLLP